MGTIAKVLQIALSVSAAARPTATIPWSRIPAGLALGATCFAIFLTAAGFMLAAVYMALEPVWGPGWAAFAVGTGLLPIGGAFAFALYSLITRPMPRQPGTEFMELADEALRGVEKAEDWVADRPLASLGGALLLGAVTALIMFNRPRRR
jgi:hypothetical protein